MRQKGEKVSYYKPIFYSLEQPRFSRKALQVRDTAEKHLPSDKAEATCVDGSVQTDYEDVCKLNFPLLTRVEVSRFWLYAVNLLKIKRCSAAFKQWGVSVA